eukprot:9501179-Alexandrium_andersonii.AAC.1
MEHVQPASDAARQGTDARCRCSWTATPVQPHLCVLGAIKGQRARLRMPSAPAQMSMLGVARWPGVMCNPPLSTRFLECMQIDSCCARSGQFLPQAPGCAARAA